MKSTFATVVWFSATMNVAEATAVHAATAISARPIDPNARTPPPCPEKATNASSPSTAKSALPATWVVVPTDSSRCSAPALDQARAASAT